ncbi:uncharacterized protein LOC110695438 isoform X2 [Chenopodium quinoa]|uniref:uncharacterized protein LOC110695438 isoform X2 n=1 Tax=Chenopodium quinoa TaxID=63459 RepID=UPI000B79421D|nr:uncharacterized protein LOC110695438 isoform X2 [Chenopodium quinoa]
MLRTLTRSEKDQVLELQQAMLRVDGLKVLFRKKQEELIKELTAAVKTTNNKVSDLELELKNAKSNLKALEEALEGDEQENTKLREDISRLQVEMVQMQSDYKAELAKEQDRLVPENERDCEERMKMAWQLIHPNTDWEFFNLRYQYATEVYDAQTLGLAAPTPFKEWAGIVSDEEEEDLQDEQASVASNHV